MGIEPTSEAWEAPILPLYYARSKTLRAQNSIALALCARQPVPLRTGA